MSSDQDKEQVLSKEGAPIEEGDHVWTKMRGGRREGEVEKIVTSEEEAREEGVKNPPKVLFTDQRGKHVAHNPGTLNDLSKEGEK